MDDSPSIPEAPWYEGVVMPALLRHARTAYGAAMRKALAAAGYDDIPGNGLYVIGGLALGEEREIPLGQLIQGLRVSKQAAGQLVDTLVLRGYLDRTVDPEDRRKLTVALTERGRAAAAVQGAARDAVDAMLLERTSAEDILTAKRVLGVLVHMAAHEDGDD